MDKHEIRRLRVTPDGRLTRREAARFLGFSEATLANWRTQGVGPRMAKVRGRVFYHLSDLQDFVASE